MTLRSDHLSGVILVEPGVVGASRGAFAEGLTVTLAPVNQPDLDGSSTEVGMLYVGLDGMEISRWGEYRAPIWC